jgi:hypothetical protein
MPSGRIGNEWNKLLFITDDVNILNENINTIKMQVCWRLVWRLI